MLVALFVQHADRLIDARFHRFQLGKARIQAFFRRQQGLFADVEFRCARIEHFAPLSERLQHAHFFKA